MKGGVFSLWIYAVPVSATATRLIINAGGNFPKPPPGKMTPAALLQRLNILPKLLRRLRCLCCSPAPLHSAHSSAPKFINGQMLRCSRHALLNLQSMARTEVCIVGRLA